MPAHDNWVMFLFGRFKLLSPGSGPTLPQCPPGMRIYAIGDVHGCLEELEALLQLVADDLHSWRGETCLIFLGDYVDRGPDSAGVLRHMLTQPLPCSDCRFLAGNHDMAMLDCWETGQGLRSWLAHGGAETLESYGIHAPRSRDSRNLLSAIHERVPARDMAFLRALRPSVRRGDYFFAHAGVRPGVRLDKQSPADLRWIRREFLESENDHGAIVVHGHTISHEPEFLPNRIGIDTGCYKTGCLTALVLENSEQRLLQTVPQTRSQAA